MSEKWTIFYDMHSGGRAKHKYEVIMIEASEDEAISVFYSRFGTNPMRVSCTCCGSDYSITEVDSEEEAESYYSFEKSRVKIFANEIDDDERHG